MLSSDTIEVSWDAWTEGNDNGDGPVIGYRVYYSIVGDYSSLKRTSEDPIQDTSVDVSNLTRDTEYEFSVTAVREGEGGEGGYSPGTLARTMCTGNIVPDDLRKVD